MESLILIQYGELTTKKANRKLFIQLLEKNIKNLLKEEDIQIRKDTTRMFIKTSSVDSVIKKLKKVFGIHGIAKCFYVNTNIEDIQSTLLDMTKDFSFETFKIVTKRADKTFSIPSMEFSKQMGAYLLKNTSLKVDVHTPDILFNIEIRREGTYLYSNIEKGIGGYPVGVQGKGLLMLSGGIDSPVAGYLSLKRGVDIDCLYFESPPHTSENAKNKVLELARILNTFSGNVKVHIVPFTKIQETIYKNVPDSYIITIMRRMMYRIAERFAFLEKQKILINGESIGQVASQTLTSMCVINEVVNIPVIRPVACFDKLEIIEIAKKIGTYETSILPYEDCCTIFLPKHPVIHPVKEKCIEYEKKFPYEDLIEETIKEIKTITVSNIEKRNELL